MVAAQEALRYKHSGCYCFVILKRINKSETSILDGIVTRTLRVDIFSEGELSFWESWYCLGGRNINRAKAWEEMAAHVDWDIVWNVHPWGWIRTRTWDKLFCLNRSMFENWYDCDIWALEDYSSEYVLGGEPELVRSELYEISSNIATNVV